MARGIGNSGNDLNARPMVGGSMDPRLNPKFGDDNTLNHKLGPRMPKISGTEKGAMLPRFNFRKNIGLPSRFDKS